MTINEQQDAIIDKFHGGPVGVGTIATAIGEDAGTIEEVYEPYLIMEGFIGAPCHNIRLQSKAFLATETLGRLLVDLIGMALGLVPCLLCALMGKEGAYENDRFGKRAL